MGKYDQKKRERNEKRRLKLIGLIHDRCDGVNANLAKKLDKEPSYINRLLYPEGKDGKKNIGDEIMDAVIDAFDLPEDWWVNDTNEGKDYGINLSKLSLEKLSHIKDIESMTDEQFQSQEGVFKAVVKSTKARKKQD